MVDSQEFNIMETDAESRLLDEDYDELVEAALDACEAYFEARKNLLDGITDGSIKNIARLTADEYKAETEARAALALARKDSEL